MKHKILCASLLVMLLFAGQTFAASATPSIADTYTVDGLTYYNVNSQNFDSDKKFYVDVISKKHSALGNHSLGDLWLMAAAGMGKDYVPTGGVNSLNPDYINRLKEAILTGSLPDAHKYIYYYSYSAPAWSNSDGGYVETSATIWPYLFTGFGIAKYTVRFSDFKVGALLPADQGLYVQSVTENGAVSNIGASSVKNDTSETINASQSVSKTVAESLTSTVNHSSTYSFTEGLKVGAEISSFGVYKMSAELSAQFSQAFTDGWSNSKGKSESTTIGSNASVTLPPYTNVLIKQGESQTTVTTRYNCPVTVGYKVTIIIQADILVKQFTFGSANSNARKDLNHRAFVEGSRYLDEETANWEDILSDSDFKDAIQKIAGNVPMSGSGATIVYKNNTTYSEVAGKTALYPLSYVELGKPNVSFIDSNNNATMRIGNYSYTDYLPLNGYNSYGAEYYGFDKSKGHWVVVDENMRELSAADSPVVLEMESATGHMKYRAVKPGTCYLRYIIDENAYPASMNSTSYTKNSDLTRTAMLPITVIEDEVTYEINGSYSGRVNAQPDNLDGEGKLEISVFDKTGKEIVAPYLWDARELKGITLLSDGTVSFTRPGTYHVRVTNSTGGIYSDWKAITAEVLGDDYIDTGRGDAVIPYEEADENTTLLITGSFVGGVSSDVENIEGLGKLQVSAFDSSGQERAVIYTWEAQEGSEGMTLNAEGNVSFTSTGSYYVRVKSGAVYSDWTEITANEKAPARFTAIPTATSRTYDGTEDALLNEDGKCEGGSIVYGLGTDDVTAPSTYSSEIPTAKDAGTYHVWCKIIGDQMHDDSEPVCVDATISEASAPDNNSGETVPDNNSGGSDGNSTDPGSSGGGCDAGVSVLGLLLSALILRRKEH